MTQPQGTSAGADSPDIAMPEFNGPVDDYADGPSSPALHNLVFDYSYSRGNEYRLSFNDSFGVSFQMMNDGSEQRGPLPYRCRELHPGQYLVAWFVRQFGIHVSLVVDFEEKSITVAAMMPPGSWEFWDKATDIKVTKVQPANAV